MPSRCLQVALYAVLVAGLAGCSFPGSVPRTVKLGLSAPFEGLYRDQGYEVLHAVRLAVRERNEAGGLCGRYLVELVALNDLNEDEEAVWQARELAADPDVMAVLGGWSPSTARAAAPEYERLGLPFAAPPAEPGHLGEEAARLAAGLGGRRAAVISGTAADHVVLADAFARAWVAGGGEVVGRAGPGPRAVTDSLAPQPDLLFLAADAPQAAAWVVQARQGGFSGSIAGGPELGSPLLPAIAADAAEGVVYVSYLAPVPADGTFVQGYQALSGGAPPGPPAAWAYTTARQLLVEIEQAADPGGPFDACRVSRRPSLPAAGGPPGDAPVYLYVIAGGRPYRQP